LELLNSLFKFFTDKSQRLSRKALLIIGGIMLLILIDNTLSFSYYYNTEKRLEQIKEINEILNDSTLSNDETTILKKLRSDLIIRKTWKDHTYRIISQIEFKSDSSEITDNKENDKQNERSYFWHFLSSGWVFIFIMIVMPFIGLADKKTSLGTTIGILLVIEPLFLVMAWGFAKAFSYIPILFGNPIVNYFLNVILSFILIYILTKVSGNNRRTTRKYKK